MIPILDIRAFEGPDSCAFVARLGGALRDFGFVTLTGHDIDHTLTGPAYAALQSFFALPERVKSSYCIPGGGGQRGYTPIGVECAVGASDPDLKEFWHVGREFEPGDPHTERIPANVWPKELHEFRPALTQLFEAFDALGNHVLDAIALHLDLPRDFFRDKVDHGNSILRPIHYPPLVGTQQAQRVDEHAVRSAAHEDINVITLLVGSGEPGLELESLGAWHPVDIEPGQVVCNVGDMLERLTNDELPSTTHRVVNPPEPWASRARYSVPFFLHFNGEYKIETLPGCVDRSREDRYPDPITAEAFLEQRLREIGLL
jgi:isopenicillin N synthase-like dioxygenase